MQWKLKKKNHIFFPSAPEFSEFRFPLLCYEEEYLNHPVALSLFIGDMAEKKWLPT